MTHLRPQSLYNSTAALYHLREDTSCFSGNCSRWSSDVSSWFIWLDQVWVSCAIDSAPSSVTRPQTHLYSSSSPPFHPLSGVQSAVFGVYLSGREVWNQVTMVQHNVFHCMQVFVCLVFSRSAVDVFFCPEDKEAVCIHHKVLMSLRHFGHCRELPLFHCCFKLLWGFNKHS